MDNIANKLVYMLENTIDDRYVDTDVEIENTGFAIILNAPYDMFKWIEYYPGNMADENSILQYFEHYNSTRKDSNPQTVGTYHSFRCAICSTTRIDSSLSVDPITMELSINDIFPRTIFSDNYILLENPTKYARGHVLAISQKHQFTMALFYDPNLINELHQILYSINKNSSGKNATVIFNGMTGSDPYHHHVHILNTKPIAHRYAKEAMEKNPSQNAIIFNWGKYGLKATVIYGDINKVTDLLNRYYVLAKKFDKLITLMASIESLDEKQLMVVIYNKNVKSEQYGYIPHNKIDISTVYQDGKFSPEVLNDFKSRIIELANKMVEIPIPIDNLEDIEPVRQLNINNVENALTFVHQSVQYRDMRLYENVINSYIKNNFSNCDVNRHILILTEGARMYHNVNDIFNPQLDRLMFSMAKELVTIAYLMHSKLLINVADYLENVYINDQTFRKNYFTLSAESFFLKGGAFNQQILNIFRDYLNITVNNSLTTISPNHVNNLNNINKWIGYNFQQIGEKSGFGVVTTAKTKSEINFIIKIQNNIIIAQHEAQVHNNMNYLRKFIPNIPLLYGSFRCNMNDGFQELCPILTIDEARTKSVSHMLMIEQIPNTRSLLTFVSDVTQIVYETDILFIIQQVMYTLEIAQQKTGLLHNDLHMGNVLIHHMWDNPELAGKNIIFNYYIGDGTIQTINTPLIAFIIDFGLSSDNESRKNPDEQVFKYLQYLGRDTFDFNPLIDVWTFINYLFMIIFIYRPNLLDNSGATFLNKCFMNYFTAMGNMFNYPIEDGLNDMLGRFNDKFPDINSRLMNLRDFIEEYIEDFNSLIRSEYLTSNLDEQKKYLQYLPTIFDVSLVTPIWFNDEQYIVDSPVKVGRLFSQLVYPTYNAIVYNWGNAPKIGRIYNDDEKASIKRKNEIHQLMGNFAKSVANITNGELVCHVKDDNLVEVKTLEECYNKIYGV